VVIDLLQFQSFLVFQVLFNDKLHAWSTLSKAWLQLFSLGAVRSFSWDVGILDGRKLLVVFLPQLLLFVG